MSNENREIKNSVFVDLFFDDETAEENIRSLYNAIHPDSILPSGATIQKIKLDNAFYMSFINDVSFIAQGIVFVFCEHQSTINDNMPLRCLIYCGRAYEKIVSSDDRYKKKAITLPRPEFYVFYNGVDDYSVSKELKLSDSYESKSSDLDLEIVVHVININTKKGNEILKRCQVLYNYSVLIETIQKHKNIGSEEPYKEAIHECISNGILEGYLRRKGSEVVNMLIAEYNYDTDIRVQRKEAFNEGEKKLGRLINKLHSLGRTDDVLNAANNDDVREALYHELGITDD